MRSFGFGLKSLDNVWRLGGLVGTGELESGTVVSTLFSFICWEEHTLRTNYCKQ